jgi:hypothetical protein
VASAGRFSKVKVSTRSTVASFARVLGYSPRSLLKIPTVLERNEVHQMRSGREN